ncbi:MAG TPA: hypothetical protein VHV30_03830, partial [Polyangiaceae bacterium]|nr:hypothetical protein [Polyangiaceae bacterium]
MNKQRVFLAAIASLGLGAAVACGSSSSGDNSNGNGSSSGGNSDGGGSSSGGGGADSGVGNPFGNLFGDGGPTKCPSGQLLCIGLQNTCADADAGCGGAATTVFANECGSNSDCQGGNVCCSSYADSTGAVILYADAGVLASMVAGVTVQCLPSCPANGASSEVCELDDAGNTTSTCPTGTSCRDFSPPFLAPRGIPNSLCL